MDNGDVDGEGVDGVGRVEEGGVSMFHHGRHIDGGMGGEEMRDRRRSGC